MMQKTIATVQTGEPVDHQLVDELQKSTTMTNSFETSGATDPHRFVTYIDYSRALDPDPLTPLTPIGKVPNFPAKLHAILSRKDLDDIICWLPHGRSWRILKPRDFEKHVMPKYFGQSKLSSFQRQANGWGFRRFTNGMSSDSYVHPLFLRGLPYLSKLMKRCSTEKDRVGRLDLEDLDLDRVSRMYPVPDNYTDDSVLLPYIIQDGPKARMPVVEQWKPKLSDFDSKKYIDQLQQSTNEKFIHQNQCQDLSSLLSQDGCLDHMNPSVSATSSVSDTSGIRLPGNGPLVDMTEASPSFGGDRDSSSNMLNTLAEVSVASCITADSSGGQSPTVNLTMNTVSIENSPVNGLSNHDTDRLKPCESTITESKPCVPTMPYEAGLSSNQIFGNLPQSCLDGRLPYARFYQPAISPFPMDNDPSLSRVTNYLSSATAMSFFTAGYAAAANAMNANQNLVAMYESNCAPSTNVLGHNEMFAYR